MNYVPTTRVKAALCIVLLCAVIVSTIIAASLTNNFLFSRDLIVKQVTVPNSGYDRIFDVYDSNNQIGELVFRINPSFGEFSSFTFDEPRNILNYILDAITLKFNPGVGSPISVYMKTNYPTVPTTFSQDKQGETTVSLKNMEVYDGGSVPIDFVIQTNGQNASLLINADVTFHETAFLQLTSLKAHVSFEAQIPTS